MGLQVTFIQKKKENPVQLYRTIAVGSTKGSNVVPIGWIDPSHTPEWLETHDHDKEKGLGAETRTRWQFQKVETAAESEAGAYRVLYDSLGAEMG